MILNMYLTMLTVIFGGILNMIFTKTNLYKKHKLPIDNFITLKDGKRIFGDNKTWIGFFSMIICCIITQTLHGLICNALQINQRIDLYTIHSNTILFNILIGFLFGFAYMLFELPNSFIKRRLNIPSGKTNKGFIGMIFFIIDQVDSLFGVIFVLLMFSNISVSKYFGYVFLGGFTHIMVNVILYKLKIRRNL